MGIVGIQRQCAVSEGDFEVDEKLLAFFPVDSQRSQPQSNVSLGPPRIVKPQQSGYCFARMIAKTASDGWFQVFAEWYRVFSCGFRRW